MEGLSAVSKHMGPKLIRLTKTVMEVKEKVTHFFICWLFPQFLGVVDGAHIDINNPAIIPLVSSIEKADTQSTFKLVAIIPVSSWM